MNKIKVFCLSISLLFVLGSSVAVGAATIYVGPGVDDNFSIIQEALNAASPYDTIIIRHEIYTINDAIEDFHVYKDHLTIKSEKGAETTTIQAAGSGSEIIWISADYTTIQGFTGYCQKFYDGYERLPNVKFPLIACLSGLRLP